MNNLAYQGAAVVLSLSLAACGDDGIVATGVETGATTETTGADTTTGQPPTTTESTTVPTTTDVTDPTTQGTSDTTTGTATGDTSTGATSTGDTSTGDTSTGDTDSTSGTDTSDTDSSTSDTDSSSSTGVVGVCGDGAIDVGEECDDGPANGDMATCHLDCKLDTCGDSLVGPDEGCDDGMDNGDMNACTAACQLNVCGDGLMGPGEGCDDGNKDDTDTCTTTCALATCGDTIVSVSEECDDGNKEDTDLCTNNCTLAECGDAIVQPVAGEACDDGGDNNDQGDCTTTCNLASCGDGLVHDQDTGTEQCDNGTENGQGKACNALCLLNVCGDNDQGPGEGCDDGNLNEGDGCNAICEIEVCGNGVKDFGEGCDDGKNGNQDDGCTNLCTVPICGDSFVQLSLGETCDLGAQNSNTGVCTLACHTAICGDSLIQAGVEQCDNGTENDNSKACKADCSDNICGDGFVEVGVEDCDDTNKVDNDDCSNVCKAALCNDGVKNGQETDIDCGGAVCGMCPTVILLAGGNTGPNGHIAGTFTNALAWQLTPLAGVTVEGVDLAMTAANQGVGVLRYTNLNDPLDNKLQYTTWNAGVWSPVATIDDTFTTFHWPSIDAADTTAQVAFRGIDGIHYYTAYVNGAWTPAQATGAMGPQAGDIAALGPNAAFIYRNQATARMFVVDRVNNVWLPPFDFSGFQSTIIPPNLRAMTAGPAELIALWSYSNLNNNMLRYTLRTNGVWAANADIPGVTTMQRIGVVALALGGVAIVYHGTDDKFYGKVFQPGLGWSVNFPLPGTPTISGTPAVTSGVGSFEAEAAFISNGQVFHTRFDYETLKFTVPVVLGGTDMRSVALAHSK